jgi:putative phosphoesterase
MKVAALYDVHGNLPALRAVLEDVERAGVDAIVVGGDVATGPLPAETTALLAALGERALFVRGNADREVVAAHREPGPTPADPAQRAVAFAAERISDELVGFLAGFAENVVLEVDGLGPVLFCHGSPRSDSEVITTATSDRRLRAILDGVALPLVVCGHTHRQFDRTLGDYRVVNAGSVGLPYEGRPGAFWALLGPKVELRCTGYDIAAAAVELRAGGFADTDELIGPSLLEPMDPDEVAAIFEGGAPA